MIKWLNFSLTNTMKQLMRFHNQGELPEKGCNMWY